MIELDVLYHKLLSHQCQRQRAEQRQRREDVITAIHEAGHAVTAAALGGGIALVATEWMLCAGMGADTGADVQGFCLPLAKGRRRPAAAVLVAGRLAEQAFGVVSQWSDEPYALDAESVRALARRKGQSEWQVLAAAEALARPVIAQHRGGIALVATELLERGVLSGPRVQELVERAARCAA